jgi:hypothetical protein
MTFTVVTCTKKVILAIKTTKNNVSNYAKNNPYSVRTSSKTSTVSSTTHSSVLTDNSLHIILQEQQNNIYNYTYFYLHNKDP